MLKHFLIVCVLGVGLYIALEPSPEGVEIPWRLKVGTQLFRLVTRLQLIGIYFEPYVPLGVGTWLNDNMRYAMRSADSTNVTYADLEFEGVPVRVFNSQQQKKGTSRPAIIFIHGGGWTIGNIDVFHSLTALIAQNMDAVVVSVEYRLAPKYMFPTAINDCTAATVDFLKRAKEFNVDPGRVAIMGDSAGGNLAAAVSQRLTFDPRYKEIPKLKIQVLIYPCMQAFDFQTPSYQQSGDYFTVILDRVLMAEFWARYHNKVSTSMKGSMSVNQHTSPKAKKSTLVKKCLSHDLIPEEFKKAGYEAPSTDFGDEGIYDQIKEVLLDPDFAPLMREELRGLPEAYILTAEYDVLRDDGIMYAKRLEKAGVKVTWKHYKKGFHGMFSTPDGPFACPSGNAAFDDFCTFARANL